MSRSHHLLASDTLPEVSGLVDRGTALARDWQVGSCAFLDHHGLKCEADYKRACAATGQLMFHAQIGYRDPSRTREAWISVHEAMATRGQTVDRYGLCLDWSMGFPRSTRERSGVRGTGLVLDGPEGLARLTASAPVAPHLGDFVLGFPAAVENTQAALAAGATSIGNLGQFFTFRLPGFDDDVDSAAATVTALALIAAQPVEVLVHSNLDDGFAAQFADLSCALGAVLLEQHLVQTLLGGHVSHCYGHHFSEGLTRMGFHQALSGLSTSPGTMIYGNTMAYRDTPAANYASLAFYLGVDIHGQRKWPSGHAVNAVPVSENDRIPDIDEIIDAQCFAQRLARHLDEDEPLVDLAASDAIALALCDGARRFFDRVMDGLPELGVDILDPLQFLLALKRLGARGLERRFGPGPVHADAPRGRVSLVPSPPFKAIQRRCSELCDALPEALREDIAGADLRVCIATTDVHEHGVLLLDAVLRELAVSVVDGGISTDPDRLALAAMQADADLVALGTYNGVALEFCQSLCRELARHKATVPVFVGGRLNQIPDASNTSLPVDVTRELEGLGLHTCARVEDFLGALGDLATARQASSGS